MFMDLGDEIGAAAFICAAVQANTLVTNQIGLLPEGEETEALAFLRGER